jgi:hypothetical protein
MRDGKGRFIKAHTHYWQYEEPNGGTSTAVCVHCNATLVSTNSFPPATPRGLMKRLMGLEKMNALVERETPHDG